MRFVAIDFETATARHDSACSLGLAVVDEGSLVDSRSWLIRPPNNEYHPFNVRLHGIGPSETASAPPFAEVMGEALGIIAGLPLVAHNASFDMSVLRHGLDACGARYPELDYYCTLVMSRVQWPDMHSYSLPVVLARCGLTHDHHNAEADAIAAAEVLMQIAKEADEQELPNLAKLLSVRSGHLYECGYSPCGSRNQSRHVVRNEPREIVVNADADPQHPFFDADVAFTGTMVSMQREEAKALVADRGGRPRTSVSRFTEYLVVGAVEYRSLETGEPSSKMRRALELKAQGAPLVILSEQEFLEYL